MLFSSNPHVQTILTAVRRAGRRAIMFPRRLLTATLCLFLIESTAAGVAEVRSAERDSANGASNSSSSTSTPSTTTIEITTTSTMTMMTTTMTTTDVHIENAAILGCRWPEDFIERFTFCADKVSLDVGDVSNLSDLRYGILSRTIMDELLSGCSRDDLTKCVKKIDPSKLDQFLARLSSDVSKLAPFEECLQMNTEAMNRLCGADTEVSRVASGAAGLHLSLMNVLVRVKKERDDAVNADKNVTDTCLRKVAQAVHITAAMYVQSEHYMDNSVLCWNVVQEECDDGCAALAAELNCLQSDCAALSASTLQDFGIWQWYFLNTASADEQCAVKEGHCAGDQDILGRARTGIATLFDTALWRKKMREVAHDVGSTLGVPAEAAIAICLAGLAAFCASFAVLFCYCYGLCGCESEKPIRRYTRLDEGDRYEESSRSLTKAVDMDGLDE